MFYIAYHEHSGAIVLSIFLVLLGLASLTLGLPSHKMTWFPDAAMNIFHLALSSSAWKAATHR